MEWELADAKKQFSELFNKALKEGPQTVSRGKDRVVFISEEEYKSLTGQKPNFIEFLLDGNIDLNSVSFERDKS